METTSSLHMFPYELIPPFSLLSTASLKSSRLVPITPLRPMWQTLQGLTNILFLSTTALCYLAIDKTTWMVGPVKCGQCWVTHHSWGRAKFPQPLPILQHSGHKTEPQDWSSLDPWVAAGRTADLERLPDSEDSENKKYTSVGLSSCEFRIVCDQPQRQFTWENKLSGPIKGTKNPSKIKLPPSSTWLWRRLSALFWLILPKFRVCPFPLHSPGLDEEIALKQFDKLLLLVIKVFSKNQMSFNKLAFKKNDGNDQETTRKIFNWGKK